jgi:hypothetical protein
MKSSEAKPLTADELTTLKSLFQRWLLNRYPAAFGGSSEESDAMQTYYAVKEDADLGKPYWMKYCKTQEDIDEHNNDIKESIADRGENTLD